MARPSRWLSGLLIAASAGPAPALAGPLDFDGAPAEEILVTWEPRRPEAVSDQSTMINRIRGLAAVLDTPTRRRLAMISRNAPEIGWPSELEPAGYIHVRSGAQSRLLSFARTADNVTLVREHRDGAIGVCCEFRGDDLDPLLLTLGGYSGPLDELPPDLPLGQTVTLPPPYRASPIILDEATVRERLAGSRRTNLPPTERYLPEETLYVRLPRGYHPRAPAGLLVWIGASPDGRPPEAFVPAADALGLVLIGAAESGNLRPTADRHQLALDAVATARERLHIDESRVYTAGISGGGRICSALAACFPDVFAGAVPIVGLDLYEHIPVGDGSFVPANYRRPDARLWRLLRERRIAPVTGELDYNYRIIANACHIMERDGLAVRLFEYEDMAHTLPTPERFAEAIGWVDEPARDRRDKAWEEAREALEGYELKFADVPVTTDSQRRILEQITVTGPWSPAAWRACELLGVVPGPSSAPEP